jgi:hypothetical protein
MPLMQPPLKDSPATWTLIADVAVTPVDGGWARLHLKFCKSAGMLGNRS